MQLDNIQLYIISIVAMLITYVVNVIFKSYGWKPRRGWLSALLYVVAGGLAFVWGAASLPPFPAYVDPPSFVAGFINYITALLTALGPVVALATLIYNALAKTVLDQWADSIAPKV